MVLQLYYIHLNAIHYTERFKVETIRVTRYQERGLEVSWMPSADEGELPPVRIRKMKDLDDFITKESDAQMVSSSLSCLQPDGIQANK